MASIASEVFQISMDLSGARGILNNKFIARTS